MVLCPVFLKQKLAAIEDLSFINHTSGNPLTNDFKLAINLKKENSFPTCRHRHIFCCNIVFLAKFNYWFKSHESIMTSSRVMTIFVYKRLTRNPEIKYNSAWVFSNTSILGQISDSKFFTNVCNKMLLGTAKCQGYSFYRFWGIKGKLTGWVKLPIPFPPRIGLIKSSNFISVSLLSISVP